MTLALGLLAVAAAQGAAPGVGPSGAVIFGQRCAACHSVEDQAAPKMGPNLYCVRDRVAGTQSGYAYSESMRQSRLRWSAVELDRFLTAPAAAVPGTKMFFAGIKDTAQRRTVINFLRPCSGRK